MPGIIFVCTANICRSPMAAGIFSKAIEEKGESEQWNVESAGTWGLDGEAASIGSQTVMSEMGIDISNHSARRVDFDLLESFDLILTMESGHKEALRVEFPELSDRVFMLSEMINVEEDIPDPIGGPIEEYKASADLIEHYILNGFPEIKNLATSADRE